MSTVTIITTPNITQEHQASTRKEGNLQSVHISTGQHGKPICRKGECIVVAQISDYSSCAAGCINIWADKRYAGKSENGSAAMSELGDIVDTATFEQILEMDDDEEEREFSKSIVYGFFEQAEQTFTRLEISL